MSSLSRAVTGLVALAAIAALGVMFWLFAGSPRRAAAPAPEVAAPAPPPAPAPSAAPAPPSEAAKAVPSVAPEPAEAKRAAPAREPVTAEKKAERASAAQDPARAQAAAVARARAEAEARAKAENDGRAEAMAQARAAEEARAREGAMMERRAAREAPSRPSPPPPPAPPPPQPAAAPARPAVAALPDFPWPPPAPSAQIALPDALFRPSAASSASLSAIGSRLVATLEQARYFEHSYYRAPGGFALVARLERIGEDGTPLPEQFRFLQPGQEPFSLATYVRQLFFAPAGFYRQIVFVVSDQPFTATGEKLDAPGAARLLGGGANRLSSDFDKAPFTDAHRVTALIYEFSKGAREGDVSVLTPGRLGARIHLDRAGIYPERVLSR